MEINKGRASHTRRYLAALLAPVAITGVMQVTWPFFEHNPVHPYVLAVIFCAWYGGLGPGLLSLVISFLLTDYFFIEPYFSFWFPKEVDQVRLLLFAVTGTFIIVMSELMHRERRRAEINLESAKRAEGSLREKERFASQIAELSPVIINVFDLATRRDVYISPDVVNLVGYSPKEMAEMEDPFSTLWHPEDIPHASEILARMKHARDGEIAEFEYRLRRRDGEWRWVTTRILPFERDEHGVVRQIITASLDITERKRAEESLKLFRSLIDRSSDAIEVMDPKTLRFLDCNESAYKSLGYSREEFLSLSVFDIDPIIDSSRFARLNEVIEKSGFATFESLHLRKDGSTFPVEINVKVVRLERDYRIAVVRDITKRKRAEEALGQAEEKYRGIFENALEGIFQTTPAGRFITANPALARMLGYDSPEELVRTRTDIAQQHYVEPERRTELKRLLEEHGVVPELEHQAYRKDGRKIWLSESVRAVRDESGTVLYYEGFSEDITERKRAEEALRRTTDELQRVMASVSDYLWSGEADGRGTWRYLYYSPVVEKITGRPPEFFLESPERWLSTVHDEDRPRVLEISERIISGLSAHEEEEYRVVRPDGTTRWVRDSAKTTRLEHGGILVDGVVSDITERKRAEARLREYEQAVEGLDEMIVVIDRDYRYLLANHAFLKYRGLEREQVIGRSVPEILGPAVFENAIKQKLVQCFGGNVVKYELKFSYPRLGERDLLISYFPIEGPTSIDRVACIVKDVTESKRGEEQLKASSEQLRALSASLQSAREEEATRIARKVHDELGAALSSLRWDLEDVDEAISESGDQSQLQELRKKIEAMIRLTDTTINTVRRIASELRPMALDALGLIEAIEWQARQFQDRTGIIVECDCTPENVDLNREQSTAVFRIFQEALTNIRRHAQATRVKIQINEEDGEFILTIGDNGRGITDDEKSGQRTLGLLGMRERAHLIGGKIDITGSDGKGTVVTVRISISG